MQPKIGMGVLSRILNRFFSCVCVWGGDCGVRVFNFGLGVMGRGIGFFFYIPKLWVDLSY